MRELYYRVPTLRGTLHVGELGPKTGRTLLMLHSGGGGFGRDAWPGVCHRLADSAEPWRCVRVDRLGYGGSDPRPEGFTSGYFHRDLAQLEQVLEHVAPGPMWISGTSDGGSLALMAAAAWPGRVVALAVDGAHYRYEPSMIPAMLDMQRRFGEKHGPPDHGEPEERRTLRLWFAGALAPAAADWTLLPELAAVQCPVSILQGELDGIVDEEHAHGLAAALGGPSRVHILPGGAHLCLRSHPDEWNEWLEESLLHPPTGRVES